jgi:hypothetical protein
MPQLVKLQDELKDSGFAIVAPHSQAGDQDDVANFGRRYKINFTLTSRGDVPGHKVEGLPTQFLFDTQGKLVVTDHHISLQRVRELVASEPHFLAYGMKYTKHKAEADLLKKSKAYGQILKKLEKDLNGTGAAAEEAKYLTTRISAHGSKKLEEAKAAEEDNAFGAQQAYTELAANWKGSDIGEKAAARLKDLKADKEFQNELKASALAHQILGECEKLIAQAGKINLEYELNRKIVTSVKTGVAALKKKYPDSKAAKNIGQSLEGYGIKGL